MLGDKQDKQDKKHKTTYEMYELSMTESGIWEQEFNNDF